MKKIDQPIVSCKVKNDDTTEEKEVMHEGIERPEQLIGATYKIKTPQSEHALYITINDMLINEQRHPYEVFINSKNMEHFQWVLALTRIVSAVFRKGGNITFLVDELKAVFDPKGGYFKKGGGYMPSLVAEIGHILEQHLQSIGMIEAPKLSEPQKKLIAEKKEKAGDTMSDATICPKCNQKTLRRVDGCDTCFNCGDSKCS